jgi:hypothetical protein
MSDDFAVVRNAITKGTHVIHGTVSWDALARIETRLAAVSRVAEAVTETVGLVKEAEQRAARYAKALREMADLAFGRGTAEDQTLITVAFARERVESVVRAALADTEEAVPGYGKTWFQAAAEEASE